MAGALPRNRGNKGTQRVGAAVSRRLRNAGWNISPSARKHKFEGVFVSAMGDYVSVLVDLGPLSEDRAERIAETVAGWGCSPEVTHDDGFSHIHFTYGR